MEQKFILAIDQGTTSSRAMIFDHDVAVISQGQKEHRQIFPYAGWVEHDPLEIWDNVREVIAQALSKANLTRHDIVAVGITNQRETTIVWDKKTGKPVYNAICWQDTRTQGIVDELAEQGGPDRFRDVVGLPLNTYFAATKAKWVLDNIAGVRKRAEAGELLFGTVDTWLLWNLTGGVHGGVHATDVTNASRTLLMNLRSLEWEPGILKEFTIPQSMMPQILSSGGDFGKIHGSQLLRQARIMGVLGDQQAATFGQVAFKKGESKNTYGTGCFLIFNTGTEIVKSNNGLLTTVGYKIGDEPTHYALEGAVAVAGSLVQWLRDSIGMFAKAEDIEKLAESVDDNGGVYLVPAFSGLYAPYWRPDARGIIAGLTGYVNKGHIARAALEATAFQVAEVLDAVNADVGVPLAELKVDGGMIVNEALMQFQADVLGVPVICPEVPETTALGAAYIAGLSSGFWGSRDELCSKWVETKRWVPQIGAEERARLMGQWRKAVTRTFDWMEGEA